MDMHDELEKLERPRSEIPPAALNTKSTRRSSGIKFDTIWCGC